MQLKRVGLLIVLAMLVGAMTFVLMRSKSPLVLSVEMAAADFFLVRTDGLRLGAAPARQDIVLVELDSATASEVGIVHSHANDAKVYRRLIDAGAKVVYDTRMIAVGDTAGLKDVQGLFDDMLAADSTGKLMRDIWLAHVLPAEVIERASPLLASNIVNNHRIATRA